MENLIIIIVVISAIINMIADILLQSGRDYSNLKQSNLEVIRATKEQHLFVSAIMGVLAISCWQAPLYLLMKVPLLSGKILFFSFLLMINSISVFHVACCMAFHIYKVNEEKEKIATKYLSVFGSCIFLFGLIYTGTMIYLGYNGVLKLNVFHYLTLPLPSVILIQFTLGRILKRLPYFSPVSGTLSMLVSIIATVNILKTNGFY